MCVYFFDEKRIPLGLIEHQLDEGPWRFLPGEGRQHFADAFLGETL